MNAPPSVLGSQGVADGLHADQTIAEDERVSLNPPSNSPDSERSRRFYADTLGLRADEHAQFELWAGDTHFNAAAVVLSEKV